MDLMATVCSTQSRSQDSHGWYLGQMHDLFNYLNLDTREIRRNIRRDEQAKASTRSHERYGFLPSRIPLGVLEKDGGTSIAGFCVKKFLGRSRTDMDSAGLKIVSPFNIDESLPPCQLDLHDWVVLR